MKNLKHKIVIHSVMNSQKIAKLFSDNICFLMEKVLFMG